MAHRASPACLWPTSSPSRLRTRPGGPPLVPLPAWAHSRTACSLDPAQATRPLGSPPAGAPPSHSRGLASPRSPGGLRRAEAVPDAPALPVSVRAPGTPWVGRSVAAPFPATGPAQALCTHNPPEAELWPMLIASGTEGSEFVSLALAVGGAAFQPCPSPGTACAGPGAHAP